MSYYEDHILEVKPEFELEAIKGIINAGDASWADFGPKSSGGEDHIKPWENIRAAPKFNGTEWLWSYKQANYWEFFQKTIFAGTRTSGGFRDDFFLGGKLDFLGPITKEYKGKKIPEHLLAIAEINVRTGENVELYKEKLVNLWIEVQNQIKKSDASTGAYASSVYNSYSNYFEAVFKLYGEMIGIQFDILPTAYDGTLLTNYDDKYHMRYTGWSKPVSYEFADFTEILLYLYLNEQNDRRERLQQIAEEGEEASAIEIPDDGSALSEIKQAANATREGKERSGEKLSVFDRLALDALRDGDDKFFENVLRESTQCILRLNLDSYVSVNESETGPYASWPRYHESIYLDKGPAASAMNKLSYCPSAQHFLHINPLNASQLVPMIRLFKTFYNTDTNLIDREVEITFDGNIESEQWEKIDPLHPRQGVGIKSVDWSLNATNPATVRNDIEFNIVFFFQTFNDLLAPRKGVDIITGAEDSYKYEDLLLRPPVFSEKEAPEEGGDVESQCNTKKANREVYDPRFYEVKAIVGWAPPPNADQLGPLGEAMKNQQLPMFLTLIDHEFSFTQEGTFELSVKYRARLESIGSDPRLDVLSSKETKELITEIEEEIKSLQKTCGSEDTIDYYRGEAVRVREKDRDALAQTILDELQDKIYYTTIKQRELMSAIVGRNIGVDEDIPIEAMVNNLKISESNITTSIRNKLGTYKDEVLADFQKRNIDSFAENHPTAKKKREEDREAGKEPEETASPLSSGFLQDPEIAGNIVIPWFYFGDLVNAVIGNALGKEREAGATASVELENLVYLFGTFEYSLVSKLLGLTRPIHKRACLTSVPVSLELFNQWFAKKVLGGDRSTYPVMQFLRDFMADVIIPSLNKTCFDSPDFRTQWYSAGQIASKKVRKDKGETLEQFIVRGFGTEPKRDEKGYFYLVNDPSPDRGPFYWCEVPKVILKTAAISLPSDTTSPGKQGKNTLGPNPLDKLVPITHIGVKDGRRKYRGQYPSSFIDTSMWEPTGQKRLTRRKNSYDQTLRNSYHINIFYVISADNYKIFGPYGTNEDPRDNIDPSYRAIMPSRFDRDSRSGVMHLYLGADRGLVKSVTFSKVDAPYLREARIQQDSLNPLALLAATYNVNLKLIGNTIFWPGQYIFVNPIGFGSGIGHPGNISSVSNQLGLGGYHLVTQVKCYIESGRFETEVKALFEFSGDGCTPIPKSTTEGCNASATSNAKEIDSPGYKPGS
jgi:hypothetical protein